MIRGELDEVRTALAGLMARPELLTTLPTQSVEASTAVIGAEPTHWKELLDIFTNQYDRHTDAELHALAQYFLSTDVTSLFARAARRVPADLAPLLAQDKSLRHLDLILDQAHPPRQLLVALKDLFSGLVADQSAMMPRRLALTFRLLVIALALARNGESISHLDAEALTHGFRYLLQQTWLTAGAREVFEAALVRLSARPPRP